MSSYVENLFFSDFVQQKEIVIFLTFHFLSDIDHIFILGLRHFHTNFSLTDIILDNLRHFHSHKNKHTNW